MHRKRWLVAAVCAAITSVAVALPLTASAGDANRVVIGVRYQVTPGTPITAVGTWVACCGIDDGGSTTAVARITSAMRSDRRVWPCNPTWRSSADAGYSRSPTHYPRCHTTSKSRS